ncbi:hypothetical protein L916_06179, partial [Phytophthora nicotianae]
MSDLQRANKLRKLCHNPLNFGQPALCLRPSWGGNSLPKTGTFSAPSSNTRTTILSNLDSKQQQGVSTAGIQHCWKDRAESSHEAK